MYDPVIILAPPRSFTSVICAMIGQHPELYGLPEVNLFAAETMRERAGLLAQPRFMEHGLLRTVAELFADEQTPQTILLARGWIQARIDCSGVAVFRELAQQLDDRILVDKSIVTVTRVENLQRVWRAFPGARFIHLTRHPRAMGESLARLGGSVVAEWVGAFDHATDPPTPDFQKLWHTLHMNIVTFLRGIPRAQRVRIRGESVLAKPELHARRIAEWLGVRTDDEAVHAMLHPEESPYASFGPVNALFGNDPHFLKDPELRPSRRSRGKRPTLDGPLPWRTDGGVFSPEVRALATEFGYQ